MSNLFGRYTLFLYTSSKTACKQSQKALIAFLPSLSTSKHKHKPPERLQKAPTLADLRQTFLQKLPQKGLAFFPIWNYNNDLESRK